MCLCSIACSWERSEQFGRVFEAGMIGLYNVFSGHYTKDLALAPKMLLKGKLGLLPSMHGDRKVLKEMFAADEKRRAGEKTSGRRRTSSSTANWRAIKMKYAYYPGCSLHSTGKDYDISAQAVCRALGIELLEIPDWICCGASSGHSTSKLLSVALPVQDLLSAQEMGLDTAVCCAACYSRLRIANVTMSRATRRSSRWRRTDGTDDIVSAVDEVVGSPYRGQVGVKHLLEIVTSEYGLDALQEKVQGRRPKGLHAGGAQSRCLLWLPAGSTCRGRRL